MTAQPQPPRLAESLLRRSLADPEWRDAVAGDLSEEFVELRAESGQPPAPVVRRQSLGLCLRFATSRVLPSARPRRHWPVPDVGADSRSRWAWLSDVAHAGRAVVQRPGLSAAIVGTLALALAANATIFRSPMRSTCAPSGSPARPPRRRVLGRRTSDPGADHSSVAPADFRDWVRESTTLTAFAAADFWDPNLSGMENPEQVPASGSAQPFSGLSARSLARPHVLGPRRSRRRSPRGPLARAVDAPLRRGPGHRRALDSPRRRALRSGGRDETGARRPVWRGGVGAARVLRTRSGAGASGRPAGDGASRRRADRSRLRRAEMGSHRRARSAAPIRTRNARREDHGGHHHAGAGGCERRRRFWPSGRPRRCCCSLIACANIANLLLARGDRAAAGVRGAPGARRAAVAPGASRCMIEGAWLALAAIAVALPLAAIGVAALHRGLPPGVLRWVPGHEFLRVDPALLLMTALLGAGATMFFSLLPALQASGAAVSDTLRQGGRTVTSPGSSLAGHRARCRPGGADAGPGRGGHADPRRRGQRRQWRAGLRQTARDDGAAHAGGRPLRRSGAPPPVRRSRARPAPRDAGGGVAGRGQLPALHGGASSSRPIHPEGVELTTRRFAGPTSSARRRTTSRRCASR